MGQKVNPHGLRVGVIKDWNTTWYADKKEFSKFLKEDNVIRTHYSSPSNFLTSKITVMWLVLLRIAWPRPFDTGCILLSI